MRSTLLLCIALAAIAGLTLAPTVAHAQSIVVVGGYSGPVWSPTGYYNVQPVVYYPPAYPGYATSYSSYPAYPGFYYGGPARGFYYGAPPYSGSYYRGYYGAYYGGPRGRAVYIRR